MKVIVTGGAGYIGSHACKALASAGHIPITYDNLRTGHRWAVKWGPLEVGDICDLSNLLRVFTHYQPDAIMHFAALAYVGESVEYPDIYYKTNVTGTLTLLQAALILGVKRFVFSSSCATYGEPKLIPIKETTIQRPINPYGRSKLFVEQILKDIVASTELGSVALRYFNAAGADIDGQLGEEHHPETHLIPLVLQAASGQRANIKIFGEDYPTVDGSCIRDYIHVSDLARAHVLALENIVPGRFSAFNLGTGTGYSVRNIIETAKIITGCNFDVQSVERRPGDPAELIADAGKFRETFSWTPDHSDITTIITTAWDWLIKNRANAILSPIERNYRT